MVKPKEDVAELYSCDFYRPAEIMDPELLYTVPEIARLLQGLEPETEVEPETEAVLVDWAIPWIMVHADELVIADPTDAEEAGHYGVRRDEEPATEAETE